MRSDVGLVMYFARSSCQIASLCRSLTGLAASRDKGQALRVWGDGGGVSVKVGVSQSSKVTSVSRHISGTILILVF